VSGTALRVLLGHFKWCALMRREALAFVHACYAFVEKGGPSQVGLCAGVRRELPETIATKGRARSPLLRAPLQAIAAMSIATGSRSARRWIPSEKNSAEHPSRGRSGFFSKIALPPPIDLHVRAARRVAAEEVRQQAAPGTPAVKGNDGAEIESSGAVDAASTLDDTSGSLCNRDAEAMGHHHHAVGFAFFCASHQLAWNTPEKLDSILVTYLDQLFIDEASRSVAIQVVAVIRHFSPTISSRGVSILPRGHRSLQGRTKPAPFAQWRPSPRCLAFAAAGLTIIHSHTSMAVFAMLSYVGYLRPSECMRLVGQNLVPLIRSQGRTFQSGGILIHDADSGIAGITGITDESVLVDMDVLDLPVLAGAVRHPPEEHCSVGLHPGRGSGDVRQGHRPPRVDVPSGATVRAAPRGRVARSALPEANAARGEAQKKIGHRRVAQVARQGHPPPEGNGLAPARDTGARQQRERPLRRDDCAKGPQPAATHCRASAARRVFVIDDFTAIKKLTLAFRAPSGRARDASRSLMLFKRLNPVGMQLGIASPLPTPWSKSARVPLIFLAGASLCFLYWFELRPYGQWIVPGIVGSSLARLFGHVPGWMLESHHGCL
jgi:hypothetical protein